MLLVTCLASLWGARPRDLTASSSTDPPSQDAGRFVNRRRGRTDRYDEWLEPFHLPEGTAAAAAAAAASPAEAPTRFLPRHTFDTRALGYAYDELPRRPPQALHAPPVLAVFESIDVTALPTA